MAYDRGFLRVSWLFAVANTDEIAVTGCNFSNLEGASYDPESDLDELNIEIFGPTLLNRMLTFLTHATFQWADYSQLRAIRIAAVLPSGAEVDPAKQHDLALASQGTSLHVLPQSSVVASLRSGSSIGKANFGRMYIPHSRIVLLTGSPRGLAANVAAHATAFATFINGCNTDFAAALPGTTPRAAIMTQAVGGVSKSVAQIAVGDVNDTQRRRRNQLPELYQFRSIP